MLGIRNPGYAKAASWFAGVVALAGAVSIGLPLYQTYERETGSEQSAASEPATPRPCADKTVRCHLLSTGIWAVIYAPTHGDEAHASATRRPEGRDGLVLWDPGGPGLRPLDAGTARALLPSWLHNRTVATFVEPWVVHKVNPECLETVTNVSAGGVLSDWQRKNWYEEFYASCDIDLYRLDRKEYEDSFKELREEEGEISGIYAQSFGSVRATAVMPELERTGGWAVMDAPAPPPGAPAPTLMIERGRAVEESLQNIMGCNNNDAPSECRKELHQTLQDMGHDDTTPAGLAGGIEEYERVTALFSLSHDLERNAEPLREILTNWPEPSKADKEIIESASFSYTRRHGDGQVLPEFVGYIANFCTAYRGWGVGPGSREDYPLGATLRRMHYPCQLLPGSEDSIWTMPDAKDAPRLLLLVNTMDPVTPPHAAKAWSEQYPGAHRLEYEYSGHAKAPDNFDKKISTWLAGSAD